MPVMSVLVIDDERWLRELFVNVLSGAGYKATGAANVEEALDALAGRVPSVVVVDLLIPSLNGLDFLDILRRRSTRGRLPLIVVSAATEAQRQRARSSGHILLLKPFHVTQLLEALRQATARPVPIAS